jgi:hypothetical protein
MPNPSTSCGRTTPETALQPFQGWLACKAGGLRPSAILLDTPHITPMGVTIVALDPLIARLILEPTFRPPEAAPHPGARGPDGTTPSRPPRSQTRESSAASGSTSRRGWACCGSPGSRPGIGARGCRGILSLGTKLGKGEI